MMGTPAEIIESATLKADPTGKSTAPTEHELCVWIDQSGYDYAFPGPGFYSLGVARLTMHSNGEPMLTIRDNAFPPDPDPVLHDDWSGFRLLAAWRLNTPDTPPDEIPPSGANLLGVVAIHQDWKETNARCEERGEQPIEHPIVTLVRDWLLRSIEVEPYIPKKKTKSSVPNFDRGPQETGRTLALTRIAEEHAEPAQFTLPGVEPATKNPCQSWMIRLFDATGGAVAKKEKGAPRVQRLFIGALIHLDIADRNGVYRTIKLPTEDVIRWIHPNGWANKRRDWDRFPEALRAIGQLPLVHIPGVGGVQIVTASVVPLHPNDPFVVFTLLVPNSAAHGARIDWELLCAYGAESATLYRAYLAAMAHLDRSAHKGEPITSEIGKPILNPKTNKPLRKKGGRIVRSDELIPNGLERYVPTLNDRGLTALTGLDPSGREYRRRAMAAFERLDDDGVIHLRKAVGGYQIFGPRKAK